MFIHVKCIRVCCHCFFFPSKSKLFCPTAPFNGCMLNSLCFCFVRRVERKGEMRVNVYCLWPPLWLLKSLMCCWSILIWQHAQCVPHYYPPSFEYFDTLQRVLLCQRRPLRFHSTYFIQLYTSHPEPSLPVSASLVQLDESTGRFMQ